MSCTTTQVQMRDARGLSEEARVHPVPHVVVVVAVAVLVELIFLGKRQDFRDRKSVRSMRNTYFRRWFVCTPLSVRSSCSVIVLLIVVPPIVSTPRPSVLCLSLCESVPLPLHFSLPRRLSPSCCCASLFEGVGSVRKRQQLEAADQTKGDRPRAHCVHEGNKRGTTFSGTVDGQLSLWGGPQNQPID